MERRRFIEVIAGGIIAAPLVVEAQPGKVFRIGILGTTPPTDPAAVHLWGVFFQRLRELGYVEGQNLTIERRFSERGGGRGAIVEAPASNLRGSGV